MLPFAYCIYRLKEETTLRHFSVLFVVSGIRSSAIFSTRKKLVLPTIKQRTHHGEFGILTNISHYLI